MADTQATWKTVLETEKATKSSLSIWVTGANKAWRAWLNCIAYVLNLLDTEWDTKKISIEAKADLVQPYTMEWYRLKLISYQEGDEVKIINGDWTYDVIDTDKQIVKAAVVHSGITNISYSDEYAVSYHLSKDDGNGGHEIFTDAYVARYMDKIRAPGSITQLMSVWTAITNLVIDADVYVDESVIDKSTGALRADATVFPVVDAINKYVDEYVNVTGYLRNETLLNYLKDVTGVVAVDLTNQKYDQAGGTSYTNVSRFLYNKRVTGYLHAGTSQLTYTSF